MLNFFNNKLKSMIKAQRRPLYAMPYTYLILQIIASAIVSYGLWWGLLSPAWTMLVPLVSKYSLLSTGWLGAFVATMLLGYTIVCIAMKLMLMIHFKALGDKIYLENCPGSR